MNLKNVRKASLREGIERRLNVLSDFAYVVRYRKMADRISYGAVSMSDILTTLRRFVAYPGLTRAEARQVRAYYAPYRVSTLAHRQVKATSGDFHPAYIPAEMFFAYIDPYMNNRKKAVGLESKCMFDRLFPGIPQPKTLACRINGYWLSSDYRPLTFDEVAALADAEEAVFVKQSDDSYGGYGVVRLTHTEDQPLTEALAETVKAFKGDILLQMPIHQHAELARFNPSSVNSYRIVTYLTPEGKPYICTAVFRMGIGNTAVDNFCSGGIMIGIDTRGRLKKIGYSEDGTITTEHPVTGVRYEGFELPSFGRALKLARRAQLMLPSFRLVSWDIAIEEDGTPVLIEANLTAGGTEAQQITNGPFLRNMTRRIVKEALKDSDFPKLRGK